MPDTSNLDSKASHANLQTNIHALYACFHSSDWDMKSIHNEVIHTYSEAEYRYILLSVVVSGCPMKGMARYDHYEEIVSSPCPPLSCHCRTIMGDIILYEVFTFIMK